MKKQTESKRKMRLKKVCCSMLILGFLLPAAVSGSDTAEAAKGTWKHDAKGWWYSYGKGAYAKSEWVSDGGKWYYFDAKGYMVTGWQKIGGKWYLFNKSGVMQTGWVQDGGKWYYFVGSGAMVTGWKQISGKWYYFAGGGAMVTGWKTISKKTYYFNSSGAMQTGLKTISKKEYYFDESGAMQTGFVIIDGLKYFFDGYGVMQTGWLFIDGNTYYCTSEGWMVTNGWKQDNDKFYLFNKDGVMRTGLAQFLGTLYFLDENGVMQTGWQTVDGKKYYFDMYGKGAKGIQRIGGRCYYFNEDGSLAIGTVMVGPVTCTSGEDGLTMIYGNCEQDNNASDGTECIEWIVLDQDEYGCFLLISKYGLEAKRFQNSTDSSFAATSRWDISAAREWLNGDFYDYAFTDAQKMFIDDTYVLNSTERTELNTTDKLFLLSKEEVEEYFPEIQGRACIPTLYAAASEDLELRSSSSDQDPFAGSAYWWLRTQGANSTAIYSVPNYNGGLRNDWNGSENVFLLRPAFWFNPSPELDD